MRVLFVAAEAYPLAKTGGLGDVARALPSALAERGADVRLLLPGYPAALEELVGGRVEAAVEGLMGVERARLICGRLPGTNVPTWLIDAPSLFARPGGPYVDSSGVEWRDNALRFAYLCHVAALIARGDLTYWKADVVHANDWHTGLLPLLLAQTRGRRPGTVFTVHNLAFQGNFPIDVVRSLGVPDACLTPDGCEFYGQASFLKAGLRYADRVTTVSPTYAKEVLTPEFGYGLEGVLRSRSGRLHGILNGVDAGLWNPATDMHLPARFTTKNISGKHICKSEIQRELGLPADPDAPLAGFISRLTRQKMADVLLEALPWFAENGAQLALVSQGDPGLEAAIAEAGRRYPENLAIHIGYEEALAHRLYAGSDMILAPARFEPCGLTQLYGMRYGSVPIVRHTGGLADTVVDATTQTLNAHTATGVAFKEPTAEGLTSALNRALKLYREPLAWRRLQLQGMAMDHGWDASAKRYLSVYRQITGLAEPQPSTEVETQELQSIAG